MWGITKRTFMKIIIAGGTGFIGQALTHHFLARGDELIIVGRSGQKIKNLFKNKVHAVTWDEFKKRKQEFISASNLVINLAGANIAEKRWTEERKEEIINSRVQATRTLSQACAQFRAASPPLFNASAVGIYGLKSIPTYNTTMNTTQLPPSFSEEDPIDFENPTDFVSKVARAWEMATESAKSKGVRVINLRFGLVLDKKGMLAKLKLPFLLGLGGPIGTGNQPFPWVTLRDLISAVDFLFAQKHISGPVNIVSPQCVPQKEFAKAFASVLNRPSLLTTPRFLVELLFGEMGKELLLSGQCAYPAVLLSNGFIFRYENIRHALKYIFRGKSE
jgi:uncharacterized protein (TIGR01777 family)